MADQMTFTTLKGDIRDHIERGYSLASDPTVFNQIPKRINAAERRIATELKVQGFLTPLIGTLVRGEPIYEKPDRWRATVSINVGVAPIYETVSRSNDGALLATIAFSKPHSFVIDSQVIVTGMGVDEYNGTFFVLGKTQLSITYQMLSNPGLEPLTPDSGGHVCVLPNKRVPVFPRSYEYVRQYWPDDGEEGDPEFYADYDYNHIIFVPTPRQSYPYEWNIYELPQLLDDLNQQNWLTDYAPQLLLYASLLEMSPFLKTDERLGTWQTTYDRIASGMSQQDIAKIRDRAAKREKA